MTHHSNDLRSNAFRVLGASTRDHRHRILELAEERALAADAEACGTARAELTNPRTRILCEIAWLPGVSPRRSIELLEALESRPLELLFEDGLPALAHANLIAAVLREPVPSFDLELASSFIQQLAAISDAISDDEVLRLINEDRLVAGFPEVPSVDSIAPILSERRRYFRGALSEALLALPLAARSEALSRAIDDSTFSGALDASTLLDDLVDHYALEVQGHLERGAEAIEAQISQVRHCAEHNPAGIHPTLAKLESLAREWDAIAQPIQLSTAARGLNHQPSYDIAYSIRSLAIDLVNEHSLMEASDKVIRLTKDLFAELPEVAERVARDVTALENLFADRAKAASRDREWANEITYHAEVGLIFRGILSISPEGVQWKNQHLPLNAITRVRYGATRHSVNGIPTGTTYTIGIGSASNEIVLDLRNETVFSTFLSKLWKAVTVRLIVDMLNALKSGRQLRFGEVTVRDEGIILPKHRFFGLAGTTPVMCDWSDIEVWDADGSFRIRSTSDRSIHASLSYIHEYNTHVLETAIRMALKKGGVARLSDTL